MINLTVQVEDKIGFVSNLQEERYIECESCMCKIKIFSYSARICPYCKEVTPNVLRMEDTLEARIKYHLRRGLAFGGI
jgi:hypothetical protein